MTPDDTQPRGLLSHGIAFLRDFFEFAGIRGVYAAVYAGFGAVLEGAGLVLLIPILNVVMNSAPGHSRALTLVFQLFGRLGADTRLERLGVLLSGFALLMLVRAVIISARDVSFMRLQSGFVETHRSLIARRLARARWDVIVRLRYARVTQALAGDVQMISGATRFMIQCGISVLMLVSQCVIAFLLSPLLAGFVYLLLILSALSFAVSLRRARELGHYLGRTNLKLTDSMAQFLGGLKLAVSQKLEDTFLAEFEESVRGLAQRQVEFTRAQTNRRLALGTLSALIGALAVLVGFGFLGVTPAIMVTLLFILSRINGPVMQIQQGGQQFAQSLPAYERIRELEDELGAAQAASEAETGGPAPSLDGSFAFEDVHFGYPGDGGEILRGLGLTAAAGIFAGITGPSGAGKTSFADLLTGLFRPDKGTICVSGKPLTDGLLGAWRGQISYVSQDPFLFHDTVRRNLLWARPDAREENLWQALRLCGAEDLVRRMEKGLDTVMGERGALVSGGERQRLALARAMLRAPKLLILDEATNAIDVDQEAAILGRLRALNPRPTIVMIAHRRESLDHCDFVVELRDGRLVPQGDGGAP